MGLLLAFATLASQAAKPTPSITDILVSTDDTWIAVTNATNNIYIFSAADGRLLRTLHHSANAHLIDLEVPPDGKTLLCSNRDYGGGASPIWSTTTWKQTGKIGAQITRSFADPGNGFEYAGDGRYVIGPKLYGGDLVCWNAQTGQIAFEPRRIVIGGWHGLAVNPKSSLVAICNPKEPKIRFWDFLNSPKAREWGMTVATIQPPTVQMMKFSRDADRLMIILNRGKKGAEFVIVRPKNRATTVAASSMIERFAVRDMEWAFDDSLVYAAGLNGQVACWDPKEGRLAAHWTGHNGAPIRALAAFIKSPKFATGSGSEVAIWSGSEGKLLRTITLPTEARTRGAQTSRSAP